MSNIVWIAIILIEAMFAAIGNWGVVGNTLMLIIAAEMALLLSDKFTVQRSAIVAIIVTVVVVLNPLGLITLLFGLIRCLQGLMVLVIPGTVFFWFYSKLAQNNTGG